MTQKTQPFDRDEFLTVFKREMEDKIDRVIEHALSGGHDDHEDSDRETPPKTTGKKRGGCIFNMELDQSVLAKMSDDEVREYLETDGVEMMIDAFQKAKALAKACKKAVPTLTRGGEGGCSAKAESGGKASGECHVSWRW